MSKNKLTIQTGTNREGLYISVYDSDPDGSLIVRLKLEPEDIWNLLRGSYFEVEGEVL